MRLLLSPEEAVTANTKQATRQVVTATTEPGPTDVTKNLRIIRNVLNFWFGKYSPDISEKKLWMIADSSVQLRQEVDGTIFKDFGGILWQLVSTTLWNDWCQNTELYGYQGKVAAIIVLDQFSRHMHRYLREQSSHASIPSQESCDQLALKTANLLMQQHDAEIQCGMIPTPMYIFSLMPFRHASQQETVAFVLNKIESSADLIRQYDDMLKRFRKATNRRMAVLLDEARRHGDGQSGFTDDDILEALPFKADMSQAHKTEVHQTIVKFLDSMGMNKGANHSIIVSLSGGVDSMVAASVLAHLNRDFDYQIRIIAVHIDYANRPESSAEADFVRRYCETLGIEYRCRRIDEVTRGVTARDQYEKISREVRFQFYHAIVGECNNKGGVVGVVLGHHRGDLRENVLSNAHKGSGPLELSGMTATSTNDGVVLFRPLLPLEKDLILDYAHKFGVPYFKDTTPHWSTRGKLRRKLLPLLEEIYGDGSMNNLSNLAVESDECRAMVHEIMLKPFMEQVEFKPMGIAFPTNPWKDRGLFYWKFILREMLHSVGLGMFSDKSIASFIERIKQANSRDGWLQCRKDYAVYLRSDGKIFILYPRSFPFRPKDSFKPEHVSLLFGRHNAQRIGPWVISSDLVRVSLSEKELEKWLTRKAVASMEEFMEGSIEYFLSVPTWQVNNTYEPRPLVYTSFLKETRPKAWKNIDMKIQDVLPLVGNDEQALRALKDRGSSNPVYLAKVILRLANNNV